MVVKEGPFLCWKKSRKNMRRAYWGWHKIIGSEKKFFMAYQEDDKQLNNPADMAGSHRDRQGIDKAPGEEQREGPIENVVAETQKGKNKVDGDPSEESDQPIDQ
jgi:hypothetical protein